MITFVQKSVSFDFLKKFSAFDWRLLQQSQKRSFPQKLRFNFDS